MFRPIKKFINYIQRNASGSAIFGNSTTIADTDTDSGAEEIGIEANKIKLSKEEGSSEGRITEENYTHKIINEQRGNEEMKRIEIKKSNLVNGKDATATNMTDRRSISNGKMVCTDLDDDIELQIKSSVMVRPSLTPITSVENLTDAVDADGDLDRGERVGGGLDRSDIDSQEDYDEYPNERADIVSLLSDDGTAGGGEDTAEEEVITEEEDLEIVSDQEHRFEDSEIIVLNDADVNSSIASDAPSEDPLAIDDLTQPSILAIKDTSSNTLDSSTNDEASTSTDLIWSNNIDILQTNNTIKPNVEKDLKSHRNSIMPISTQQRQLVEGKEVNSNASSTIIGRSITTSTTSTTSSTSNTSVTVSITHRDEHTEELRSDGSDSGLGSETSTLQTTLTSLADTSQLAPPSDSSAANTPTANKSKATINDYSISISSSSSAVSSSSSAVSSGNCIAPTVTLTDSVVGKSVEIVPIAVRAAITEPTAITKPLRSNLKRRLEDDDALIDTEAQHQTQLCTIDGSTQVKKFKRSINFDNVEVYYFPRQQGFGCVPSAGGCTLGMGARHIGFKTLTLAEHAAELRRAHRLQLQEINPRGFSSDDSEESEEDYLSEGSGSDLDAESNGFLQPVSPKQRRALLKAAGVRKIDAAEKIECRDIRNSREVCGCSCVEFCDPETCACSQAGIKCQVDRAMFPCGCTRDACGNIVGRVEFNPTRVRTHFIHTIMRLEMENRQQQNPPLCSTVSSYSLSACATSSTTMVGGGAHTNALPPTPSYANSLPGSYYTMQTQSNYSSGYASPAYTSEPAANYYQQQSSSSIISSCSTATELQTSAQQNYQLDTLDGGIFTGDTTSTPGYGEMLPAYGSTIGGGVVSESTATVSAYHPNINYSTVQQTQVSTYTAYQQASSSGYLTAHSQQTATSLAGVPATNPPIPLPSSSSLPPTTYSSCAVPSLPPYGTATTTAAAAQYENSSSYALVDTTAPSCITMEDSGGSDAGSDGEEDIAEDNCASIRIITSGDNDISSSVHTVTIDNNQNDDGNILANDASNGGNGNDNDSGSGSDSSFIQLSTPISSAVRLSQINDLLEHNRHTTTATLVAVSHTTTTCLSVNGSMDNKRICNRSVTTDCDYNDNSNSLDVQYKEGERSKEEEKKTLYITVEKEQITSKKHSDETTVNLTEANDDPPPVADDAKANAVCIVTMKNTDTVVATANLNATTVTSESHISAAINKAESDSDLKTTASIAVSSTNTTTETATVTVTVTDSTNATPILVTSNTNVVTD